MQSRAHHLNIPSEQDLLDWLSEKPRTLGWDMWVAYDRGTVNRSLAVDYSERFDSHPLAKPSEGVVSIVENLRWEHLYRLTFGAPELSFSEARITSPRVGLGARALAGVQLTVDQPGGIAKRIIKVEEYTPLQGPRLAATTDLTDLSLGTNTAAVVGVDLSAGDSYQLSFAETGVAQREGGKFLQGHFAALPQGDRLAVVNHIGGVAGDLFAPAEIRPRAFHGPGEDANRADGGVLLFVAMKGSAVGALPGDDQGWPYPVPSGYSATMVLSTHYLMTKAMAHGVRGISTDADLDYDNPDDPFLPVDCLKAKAGVLKPVQVASSVPPFTGVEYIMALPLADTDAGSVPFHIERSEGGLKFRWKGSSFGQANAPLLRTGSPVATTEVDHAWLLRSIRRFTATEEGGLDLIPEDGLPTWTMGVYRQNGLIDASHYQYFTALSQAIDRDLAAGIDQRCAEAFSASSDIDSFRDSGLYFPGSRRLHFDSAQLPNELAAFGRVLDKEGPCVVDPPQVRIAAGATTQFQLTSGQMGEDWAVSPVDGYEGDGGSISASGEYSAPEAGDLNGGFLLAKVTASKDGQRSSALVAVVAEDMGVNPIVFVSWPNGPQIRVAAGCLDGGDVEWTVRSESGATLRMPTFDDDALFDPNDRIYVPGASAGDRFFSVDEVVAHNPRTGASRSTSALVIEKSLSGEIVIQEGASPPPGQIQFSFEGTLGPIEGASWEVAVGAGSIDSNGLYTMDPGSQHSFAVVVASYTHPGVAEMVNFRILPLPLISLDELNRILA